MRSGSKPIVFDIKEGYFWKGRESPNEYFDKSHLKDLARIKDIHALQIIEEYVSTENSSYYSYELNLVLRNGKRFNLIDHNKYEDIYNEAKQLCDYLSIVLWDATSDD